MKIAYPMRIDALDKPGGDLHQIQAYIKSGQRIERTSSIPFTGKVIVDLNADFSDFDIVHLTNIDRPVEALVYYLSARKAGKPIVLSAIHHSYGEIERYEKEGRGGIGGFISGNLSFRQLELVRGLIRCASYPQLAKPTWNMMHYGMGNVQRTILAGVDRILILAEKERVDILRDFGDVTSKPFVCLRNGCEMVEDEASIKNEGHRDFEVCIVGRIEARKNQIKILEALENLGLSGVFIGPENLNHKNYCRTFKTLVASSNSQYLAGLSHNETLRYMRRSKLHVSASWFEVSSLVDLEAYSAGCAVVSSQCGGTRELLGEKAEYVKPGSTQDIERGIVAAMETTMHNNSTNRPGRQLAFQNWDAVSEQLSGIYYRLLSEP